MDALALAVATAVLQYLVDKADLIENVRGWLKRDPASLAYQRALLRAYAAFARSDPALAKSFFDETFLAGAAVPELAKQLTRHQHANSAELARLWAASLFSDALAEKRAAYATDARVVHACANFLQWLENELKREQVFQPLFDSRALDALEAKFDDLVRVLTSERNQALRHAVSYQPVINQIERQSNVNISDNANVVVYGDFIGGDKIVHNYFYGNFTSLDDYYIAPDSVFQRVKVNEFVGREWLTSKLDHFLDDTSHTSGVFRLEGEAGVGKTSFLARLVRERGYLHLFAEQVPGDNNVERALLSLGAQIVSRYRLDPYADRDTLPAIAGFSDFLYKLLNMASQRLAVGEKIIIVCDALDEAGNGTNGNVFGLPTTLPENVFFVLSQRPVSVRLEIKCDIHQERLKPDAAENLQDMRDYLRGMARRPAVAQQLKARNYAESEFVSVLSEKSGGVWMYLHYVMDEIQRGVRHPLELENLPNGLVGYYLAYWGDWRAGRNQRGKGESEWYALYLPLLTTLAAAPEPIPLDTLIAWAGVNESQYRVRYHEVRNLLREQWRAFITERQVDRPLRFSAMEFIAETSKVSTDAPRYILYHASLRDFLTGKVKTDALATADGNFIDELREGTRAAHQRIVKNFAERCRGEWTDLIPDEYARRYLTLHLQGAEKYDVLAALVAWSDAWAKARYDKEEFWSGYLTDLERVWAFAEQKENIGWQIRCALIESTIHSLAANIFPELLVQLVETKMWSPARALAHIPQMPEDSKKAEALEKLAPLLPRELLGEALTAARTIQNEEYRANALSGLAAHLSAEQLNEALTAARTIQNEEYRARALSGLAAHLSAEEKAQVVNEALTAARAIQSESYRAFALSELAAHLSAEQLGEALRAAREIQDKSDRVRALRGLAAHVSAEEKVLVVNEALTAAREIQDEYWRANALGRLAAHLSAEQLGEALRAARAIQDESARVNALSGLAAHLSGEEKEQVVNEALTAARASQGGYLRTVNLARISKYLSEEEKAQVMSEALAAVRNTYPEKHRASALGALVPDLPDRMIPEGFKMVEDFHEDEHRSAVLCSFAPRLYDKLKFDAWRIAHLIDDGYYRARALSALAPYPPRWRNQEEVRAIPKAIPRILVKFLQPVFKPIVDWKFETTSMLLDALSSTQRIGDEDERARLLVQLAKDLPAKLSRDELAATEIFKSGMQLKYVNTSTRLMMSSESDLTGLKRLLWDFADVSNQQLLQESTTAPKSISFDPNIVAGLHNSMPQLSEPEQQKLLFILFHTLSRGENDGTTDRALLLERVVNEWDLITFKGFDQLLLSQGLHNLSHESRRELIRSLSAILSLIKHVGGKAAVGETFYALRDVGRWWP